MLNGMFFVCLSLSLWTSASSLSCRWMQHKFQQFSKNSLVLIDSMGNNSTNTTNTTVDARVGFPNHLYNQASKASAEDKLSFTVQILEEMVVLFEEDNSKASWEEIREENFLQVVTQVADGLRSCIGSHSYKRKNKKIQMYFKRLSSHVLEQMDNSAQAWELIRKEMKTHLVRADLLCSSLLTN
ncbi:interferon a3-like [Trematomus bernacchii]|uniref:interferon a3-like n=1 Tax=Trematomus bernacchii TaxID=40690 RepID=UPI00146BF371|nr:interferon a3-like [Trematomus bernacchii]